MFRRAIATAPQRFTVVLLGLGMLEAARPERTEPPPLRATVWNITNRNVPYGATIGDTAAARHLLSRATFGVRRADLERVLEIGPEAWLEKQLRPDRIDDSALEDRLALFPAAGMDQAELYERFPPPRALQRELNRRGSGERNSGEVDPEADPEAIRKLRRELGVQPPGRILFDLAGAKVQRAVYSERQLEEVMTDFWFNHFNVFFGKSADRWLVGEYEREAIRPNVFGRFEDMLVATAQHPAMLFYLHNWRNVAPDSLRPDDPSADDPRADPRADRFRRLPEEQRRRLLRRRGLDDRQIDQIETVMRRQRETQQGINENYARELLELHTLGVDAGYGQDDVIEVARVFTGWGIRRPRRGQEGPITFAYEDRLHDPTDKWVLGEPVEGGSGGRGMRGMQEGLDVLARLAVHPSTARHIATKLAVAFVADDPPEAIVAELERVFLETGGDLRAVTYALFTSAGFRDPAVYGAKLKSPFELVASALRVSDARVGPSREIVETLRGMGELPYTAQPPTGFSDEGEDWSNSGAV
ncbi:MAG: DUF1800 domain-containing protein, partial [Gemmatimonadota bacterium]